MTTRYESVKEYFGTLNTQSIKLTRAKHKPTYTILSKQSMGLLHAMLRPDTIVNNPNYLQLNDGYHRVVAAAGYPSKIKFQWFYDMVNSRSTPVDYTQHIEPQDTEEAIAVMQKHIQKLATEIKLKEIDEKPIPEHLKIKIGAAKTKLAKLSSGEEKSFTIANYFTVSAPDQKMLTKLTANIRSMLGGKMIIPQVLTFQHLSGYTSMMPTATDTVGLVRHVDSTSCALSLALPGRARLNTTEHGQILFVDRKTGLPIAFDRFDRSMMNANVVMLAGSGRGKSFLTTKDILQQIYEGRDIMIIDYKGEYAHLIKHFDGVQVEIKEGSNIAFNPFQLNTGPSDTLTTKQQDLPAFFDMLIGGVTDATRSILISVISETYAACGITESRSTWTKTPPSMIEFYTCFKAHLSKMQQGPTYYAAETLLGRIAPFADGPFKSFFCGTEQIDLDSPLINYDISQVPETVRPAIMYMIMNQTYDYMLKSQRGFRTLYMDEAWSVLSSESKRVKDIVKTCRSFRLSLFVITQDLDDVISSAAGMAILGNTAVKIILGMEHVHAEPVGRMTGLQKNDWKKLKTMQKGEGFIIIGGTSVEFKTPSSKMEYDLITNTKPNQSIDEIEMDLSPEFYRQKGLSEEQQQYLLSNDFEQVTNCPTLGKGNANYYIRDKPKNQGEKHFILTRLIAEAAESADLGFEIHDYGLGFDVSVIRSDGRILGFEVETGSNNSSSVIKKVTRLNEECSKTEGKEWYFVVPSGLAKKYAEHHGQTVTRGTIGSLLSEFAGVDENKTEQ
jgi:hypothetical protein